MTSHCRSCNHKISGGVLLAFKIFRFNCCGLDVHKTWIYACIGITDANGRTEYKEKRFSSFSRGLRELAAWLASYNCTAVCMESSGKYWIPVFNVLEKTCNVVLAHPKYTKPQKGNKTDRKDAKWICDLFMCDMIKPSFIPPAEIRHLRDLVRYRFKLTNMLTGEKNRAQNCLTVSNLKLDDVFSDVFGKSSRSITEYILAHPGETFDVTPFVDKRCKAPIEEIQAAVDGAVSPEQAIKLRQCLDHIDELEKHKKEIEREILRISDPYLDALDLIRFKIKSTRISRAGSYLKPVLVQVANALIKSKKHPEITERYRRIKSHRGHKKAIIAICRMLLTAIWHILTDLKPYTAEGYLAPRPVKKEKILTTSQALNLLKLRGYVIKDDLPATAS